ncbi:MAG: hypothetical protein OXI16_14340 [Chloroflexota bacterium]|nr:hypothetical protein [Chloroflexota bacterium]
MALKISTAYNRTDANNGRVMKGLTMALTDSKLLYTELKTNNMLLRRLIKLQELSILMPLAIARDDAEITQEQYEKYANIVEGKGR